MRVTMSFNLPEDREEHEAALQGGTLRAALEVFDNKLRNMLKYEDKKYIRIENVRKILNETLSEYDLV